MKSTPEVTMRQEMVIRVTYTNHRGETRLRLLYPAESGLWFGSTKWHPEQQWFLRAVDLEDANRVKDFALAGLTTVEKVPAESMPKPRKPEPEVVQQFGKPRMQDVIDTIGDLGDLVKDNQGSGFEEGE